MAITFIRRIGDTHSLSLCKESHLLWHQAIRRNFTVLPPQWLSTSENKEADFLSSHRLQRWDFKLVLSEFWRICHRFQVWPTLNAFASRGSHQIHRYITWEQGSSVTAIDTLDYYWDPETWLFPPVPPHSSTIGGGPRTADRGDSDLCGVGGSNLVASAGRTEDINGCNPSASSGGLLQVSQGEYRGAPQIGSTLHFSHQQESCLESGGDNPKVLDDADQAFLMNYIRKGTRGAYKSGWRQQGRI